MIPLCPYCPDGLLEPVGLPEDRAGRCTDCGRLHLEGAVPMDYELPMPAWHEGASAEEVLAFRLSPGYQAKVALLEPQELLDFLALAVARCQDPRTLTAWLERYTGLLVDEQRRRKAGMR